MEDKKTHFYSNCFSSHFLNYKGPIIQEEDDSEFKENLDKNLKEKFSDKGKIYNINLSMEKFMENQNKKQILSNLTQKDVENFLKEKELAMQKIIINEDLITNNTSEEYNDEKEKDNQTDKKPCNFLVFHGTFGKNECQKIMNQRHHHHHHHHHKQNLKKEDMN